MIQPALLQQIGYPGLYVGEVSDVEDPEKLGRIKVNIPSIFGEEDPSQSTWARPCFMYGNFHLPEVGNKVWIAFENGNPSSPVWLGIWYPTGTVPEEADSGYPYVRQIKSSSGHSVILDDSDGAEELIVKDKFGNEIKMTENKVTFTFGTEFEIDASGQNIVIKASSVDVQSA